VNDPIVAEDPRRTLAFNESLRALTQQAGVLDALRTRTGILLTAISITGTFLGSKALNGGSLSGWDWAGAFAFALALLAVLAVLLPRNKWEFSMEADVILDGYVDTAEPAALDDMHSEFARLNQKSVNKNDRRLQRIFWAFRISVAMLALSIALWLTAIAESNGEKTEKHTQATGGTTAPQEVGRNPSERIGRRQITSPESDPTRDSEPTQRLRPLLPRPVRV
jgi:hypothetical protein